MSAESALPPPPPPSKGRNPWKIFGIITIVLVLVGGAVAAGYFLGSSDDSAAVDSTAAATIPPATTQQAATTAPPTTFPNDSAVLATIAQAEAIFDNSIYVDSAPSYGKLRERYLASTTCERQQELLEEITDKRDEIEDFYSDALGRGDELADIERRLSRQLDAGGISSLVELRAQSTMVKIPRYPGEIENASSSWKYRALVQIQYIEYIEGSLRNNC